MCDFSLCVVCLSGCYGVSGDDAELDAWLCARCEAGATTEVRTHLFSTATINRKQCKKNRFKKMYLSEF